MVAGCDFRDLLAECARRALQKWGLGHIVASSESLAEVSQLGDENTFFHVAGLAAEEDRERCLSGMIPWTNSEVGHEQLMREGQRWEVKRVAVAAASALADIRQSLEHNWTPARAGMLARALPAMVASRFTPLADRLSAVLGAATNPESLMAAYAGAFRRDDRAVLYAVDEAIIDDPMLGTLVVEIAGRLLRHIGAADLSDPESRDKVVGCLALLIEELMKTADATESDSAISNQ